MENNSLIEKYIEVKDTVVQYIHYCPLDEEKGMGKSREQLLRMGILTTSEVPEPKDKADMKAILHYERTKGFYYTYEYIDISTMTLEELKEYRINLSKKLLSDYLSNNPLKSSCHGGKEAYYSITQEKMNMFTTNMMSYTMYKQAGIPSVIKWNSTAGVCEEWTEEECFALLMEWKPITEALVGYQQSLEVKIRNASIKEKVLAIDINYSLADPRNKK